MSEEQLKELQEYNLEYLEAQQSEEIFGGDYTSAVELKYAKKEIERLNKELEIRDILIKGIDKRIDNHFRKIDRCIFEDTNKLIEIQDLIKKTMESDKE